VVMGLVSWLFIQSIYKTEDFFERIIPHNEYVRHMAGMLGVGALMYFTAKSTGHYFIQGVGYSTVQDILMDKMSAPLFLLFLCAAKLLATCVTLGSGGSGGIFSPLLFIGAALGDAYGLLFNSLFPELHISAPAFAVAGMAGMVGGATGAAITAIVMIFEMTLDYNVILPITVTVAVSYGLRKYFSKDSIYTLKLARRGHRMPEALHANFQYLQPAFHFMSSPPETLPSSGCLSDFADEIEKRTDVSFFVVQEKNGKPAGVLSSEDALRAIYMQPQVTLSQLANPHFIWIGHDDSLFEVLGRLNSEKAAVALVHNKLSQGDGSAEGLLSKLQIEAVIEKMTDLYY
jgi:CIC family chloride channel protein